MSFPRIQAIKTIIRILTKASIVKDSFKIPDHDEFELDDESVLKMINDLLKPAFPIFKSQSKLKDGDGHLTDVVPFLRKSMKMYGLNLEKHRTGTDKSDDGYIISFQTVKVLGQIVDIVQLAQKSRYHCSKTILNPDEDYMRGIRKQYGRLVGIREWRVPFAKNQDMYVAGELEDMKREEEDEDEDKKNDEEKAKAIEQREVRETLDREQAEIKEREESEIRQMRAIEEQKLAAAFREKQDMRKRKQQERDDEDVRAFRAGRIVRKTVPSYLDVDEDEDERADEYVNMRDDACDY
jgi:hypothetical protein